MPQALVNGLLLGATYALLALGYTLVFGTMRLLTLAHGQVFMASTFLALMISTASTPFWVSGLLAVAIGSALGMATDVICFRAVGYDRPIAAAVSTIGFAIALQAAIVQLRGSSTALSAPFHVPSLDWRIGSILVSAVQAASLVIAGVLMIGLAMFIERNKWGSAMRAFSHDPEMVTLMGVPVRRLTLITMGISGGLAAVSSFLLVLRTGSASPFGGVEIGLVGLAVMTIGGLGSLRGAMIAGLGLGVIESIARYQGLEGWLQALPWGLLILTLTIRPTGLIPQAQPA